MEPMPEGPCARPPPRPSVTCDSRTWGPLVQHVSQERVHIGTALPSPERGPPGVRLRAGGLSWHPSLETLHAGQMGARQGCWTTAGGGLGPGPAGAPEAGREGQVWGPGGSFSPPRPSAQ